MQQSTHVDVWRRWGVFLALALALTACGKTTATPTATPTPTQSAAAAPTATVTLTPRPIPPTLAPEPTYTPTLTPKPLTDVMTNETATVWVGETIPDGTIMQPGQVFTKTWTIGNAGPGVWTTDYDLFLIAAKPATERLGAPESIPLEHEVKVGETITFSLKLTAPNPAGLYTVVYRLRNGGGEGVIGSDMWVTIRVGNAAAAAASSSGSSATTGSVTAVLLGANQQAGEVTVNFCMQMPDGRAWYPWQVTLTLNQQVLTPEGSRIDPATATNAYKCFGFSFSLSSPTAAGAAYQLAIGKVELPPEVNQAENCAQAQQTLMAAYPGLDFTCGGPGYWYTGLVTPPGMTDAEADRLILDAMSSAIYGPWTLSSALP